MSEVEIKNEMAKHMEHVSDDDASQLKKEERALVRKIDIFLLPAIWLMYLLSYLDRTKYEPTPSP